MSGGDFGRTGLLGSPRISVAIVAMGGQGGGVLADWIVALAEREGWAAQSTSVPGVAQRTGATIYYIEMAPAKKDAAPVFALMPAPGDVDVVLAAELMEAGRSMMRGLVTPERTTLIASTHRAFAVAEKQTPGDGVADPGAVSIAADFAAKRVIAFDMEALAKSNGSVISAAMFGALAGAAVLPFDRAAFESAVREGGTGVESSLRAFAAAFDQVQREPIEPIRRFPKKRFVSPPESSGHPELDRLVARIRTFPAEAQPWLFAGVRRLVDYLDPAYALEYLDRVGMLSDADRRNGGEAKGFAFTSAAAKYLAVAMAYDDVARVADLKIREVSPDARAAGGRRGRRYDRRDHRIFPSARGGALRFSPQGLGRVDRKSARRFQAARLAGEPGPPNSHGHRDGLSDPRLRREPRPPPPKLATPRPRGGASRSLARRRARGAAAPL